MCKCENFLVKFFPWHVLWLCVQESNENVMKRLLFSVCILSAGLISQSVHAQQAGIKGGVSFTGVSALSGSQRTTGHGGFFVNSKITNNWAFQPELLYSAQGQHFTNELAQRRVLALDYIQVPLMIQYHPVPKFYLEAGPQVGVLVNSSTHDAGSGNDKNNVNDSYRKADVGINAGVGVNITNRFGIYGRYTQGLMDITKSNDTYRTNNGIQLGAAIKF